MSGAEAPDPLPVEPKKPGRGLRWAILAAVAAVVALAIVLWPRVFPGGSVAMESPSPTGTLNASPTPTLPTTPSPSVSRTTLPPVRDVGTLTAVRVTQPLTIDGKTDDWQWQLVARADQRIAGSSRATGDIYLMWDDQALYLLASVTDATPLPPDAGPLLDRLVPAAGSADDTLGAFAKRLLGIGAGAHSKLTLHDRVLRQMRWKQPTAYLDNVRAGNPIQTANEVVASQLPFEFLMNALRLHEGFPPALFESRTAQPLTAILPRLKAAETDGLLTIDPERIAPTLRGRRFLNVLLERFLDDDGEAG